MVTREVDVDGKTISGRSDSVILDHGPSSWVGAKPLRVSRCQVETFQNVREQRKQETSLYSFTVSLCAIHLHNLPMFSSSTFSSLNRPTTYLTALIIVVLTVLTLLFSPHSTARAIALRDPFDSEHLKRLINASCHPSKG